MARTSINMTASILTAFRDRVAQVWYAWRLRSLDLGCQPIVVLAEQNALYFPIPKVACSSVYAWCADVLRAEMPEDSWRPSLFMEPDWQRIARARGWMAGREELSTEQWNFWKFAIVRNPWDRLVSCYAEKIRDGDSDNFVDGVSRALLPYPQFRGGMTFDAFANAVIQIPDRVAEPHFRSQHTFLLNRRGELLVDFLGRLENMETDFRRIQETIGVDVSVPHLLSSDRKSYQDYYSPALRHRVARRYAMDIERFGYRF